VNVDFALKLSGQLKVENPSIWFRWIRKVVRYEKDSSSFRQCGLGLCHLTFRLARIADRGGGLRDMSACGAGDFEMLLPKGRTYSQYSGHFDASIVTSFVHQVSAVSY
jgi:hypothetical protein